MPTTARRSRAECDWIPRISRLTIEASAAPWRSSRYERAVALIRRASICAPLMRRDLDRWFEWTLAGLALSLAACSKTVTSVDPVRFDELLDPAPVVHVTAAGVSPQVSHLARAVAVRFVNDDVVAHRLASAPELGYGECAEMAGLGVLQPGASGSVLVDRADAYCAFHDQTSPASFPFQGILVVH